MSPKPDVSEERTNQIMEAAMSVFARLGFNKARMDDIAEETNLSKGTLYLYFKSKDDLISALINRLFDVEFEKVLKNTYSDGTVADRLLHMTDDFCKNVKSLMALRPVIYEVYAASFRQKAIREVMKSYYDRYLDFINPIVQEGIDNGEFKAVDADMASIASAALIEGTILMWVYNPDRVDLQKHIHDSMQVFLTGLKN
jgi:AcrR family transcriptional regulator